GVARRPHPTVAAPPPSFLPGDSSWTRAMPALACRGARGPTTAAPPGREAMPDVSQVVFLLDVDNTLLDNDQVAADLRRHLTLASGARPGGLTGGLLGRCAAGAGYMPSLGALQRSRVENRHDPHLLEISSYLVDYPFANRLFPRALDLIKHLAA